MINERLLLIVLLSIGVLFACNNDNDVVENPDTNSDNTTANMGTNKDDVGTDENVKDNMLQDKDGEKYNFSEFSLEVEYSATEAYEADYEYQLRENQRIVEASIEDDRNKEYFSGDEAYSKLRPLLKQINFDESTSNDEVLNQIVSIFSISDDYTKIDVDVTFSDGTKREYTFTK
ncbi:YusW family protein [Lysinibacillus sp. 54212]|uniref:YusW family protein n=1 Tax=Lysinibacillus sp. 54212 TaxID=3119829 RepID=UPI002FC87EAA